MSDAMISLTGKNYTVLSAAGASDVKVDGVNPHIVALALARGIPEDELQDFFFPTISKLMPNPKSLQDLDGAAHILSDAVMRNEKVGMVGDYDVDGATSVAIMQTFLLDSGMSAESVQFYIPQRMTEGYGVSILSVDTLHRSGCRVLLVLDSGTSSFDVIKHAVSLGMKVVVVDHHEIDATWENPCVGDAFIVNPKRLDDTSGVPYLCTAGLAIMLCVRMATILRERNVPDIPDVMDYMGLAALGTVADLMVLRGLNRAIVRSGLDRMHILTGLAGLILGINGLKSSDDFPKISAKDLGFGIGPCVNAGGRINDCYLGSQALTSEDVEHAIGMGVKLREINKERRSMQGVIETQALEACKALPTDSNCVVLYDEAWHPGVIGIVASRIKDHTNLPTIIIGEGGKGSGRSAHGFDLGHALIDATKAGILVKGGGHKAAGGLTIDLTKIEEFRAFMKEQTKDLVKTPARIDGVLSASDLSSGFERSQAMMEPFGMGNRQPIWLIRNVMITDAKWVGREEQIHLKLLFQGDGARLSGIIFSAKSTKLAELASMTGKRVSLAVEIKQSDYTFNGSLGIDIIIRDAFMA